MDNFSNFDPIATSISKIDQTFYTHYEDGSQVHQTSALRIIIRMIQMLAPCPGICILEIGTGSGYSTAILANIVGEFGAVTSVDIDTDMVKRASRLLRQDGHSNVRVLIGDGRIGRSDYAPYDRIIVWASAENEVPLPLVEQIVSDGIIVCPIKKNGNSYIASFQKNQIGKLEEINRISGGFIPLSDTPLRPWLNEN